MLGSVFRTLLLATLAAGASFAGCTGQCAHDNLACEPFTTFVAHLQTTREVLLASTATLCVDGACAPLAITAPTSDSPSASLEGGFVDLGGGWVMYTWRPLIGALVDGDVFRLTVTGPGGASLLDVTRTVSIPPPPEENGCDDGCGGDASTTYDLYASSLSGQTCQGDGLGSTVTLTGDLGGLALTASNTMTLCQQEQCGTVTLAQDEVDNGQEVDGNVAYSPLRGFDVELNVTASGAIGGTYSIELSAEPEQLADGDVYTVKIDDGAVYTRQATATYTKNYPDGQSCDAMPVKTAHVKL